MTMLFWHKGHRVEIYDSLKTPYLAIEVDGDLTEDSGKTTNLKEAVKSAKFEIMKAGKPS